jgi:hypothetical protein
VGFPGENLSVDFTISAAVPFQYQLVPIWETRHHTGLAQVGSPARAACPEEPIPRKSALGGEVVLPPTRVMPGYAGGYRLPDPTL